MIDYKLLLKISE